MEELGRIVFILLSIVLLSECRVPHDESADSHRKHTLPTMDPEVYMDATELITSKGFPCENYYVTTKDGYILNVLRIPYGRKPSNTPGPRPAVLLQHGLLGSSTNFLTNLVNQSLAYLLADAGADVWLGNSRGTIYSMNHTKLSPEHEAFWKFTWDDMAKYDLPAVIQFIRKTSGVSKIFYVGHSQGTIQAFAGFSQNKELSDQVEHFFALAPVTRVGHMKSPIRLLAPYAKPIELFLNTFGHGQFAIQSKEKRILQGSLCQKWGAPVCESLLFIVCGFDYKSFNMTRMPVYISHNPGGTSTRNILHWAQLVISKQFQMYDYGTAEKNLRHYGQDTPPIYDPRNVTLPVTIFRGGQDWLADNYDADWLVSQLPNVHKDVFIAHYAHLDFIWAFDSPTFVYDRLIDIVMRR